MTRDEAIKLARQAGATTYTNRHYPDMPFHTFSPDQLEQFHALVIADFLARGGQYVTNDATREAAIAVAVAAEREACAVVCDNFREATETTSARLWLIGCTTAIRARGQA